MSPGNDIRRRTALKALGVAAGAGVAGTGLPAATAGEPATQESAGRWSTYMHGARKRGYNPDATGIRDGVETRWTVDRGSDADPVVADGTVYVGAESLWALSADDGTEQWSFDGDGGFAVATVVDDAVYAGTAAGELYALAAGDGAEQWNHGVDNAVSGLTVAEGTVFAVEQVPQMEGDRLHAIDAGTGEERWTFERGYGGELGSNPRMAPEPAVADGTAYVKADTVYALDVETGETVWQAEDSYYTSFATLSVADGTVYASTEPSPGPGEFRALDASDGSVEWAFSPELDAREWSAPVVGDDAVYVGQNDRDGNLKLYALGREDGSIRWEIDDYAREAALAGGVLYLALRRESGDLHALDAGDGSLLWTYEGETIDLAPALAGDAVYAGARTSADTPRVVALERSEATPTGTDEPTATGTDGSSPTDDGPSTGTDAGADDGTGTPTDTPTGDGPDTPGGTTPENNATGGGGPGFGVLTAVGGVLGGVAYYLADIGRDGDE